MNLHALANTMVQTTLAVEKTTAGLPNADETDLARRLMTEPDVVWHICETYARTASVAMEQLPISQLRGLICEIFLAKLPAYD